MMLCPAGICQGGKEWKELVVLNRALLTGVPRLLCLGGWDWPWVGSSGAKSEARMVQTTWMPARHLGAVNDSCAYKQHRTDVAAARQLRALVC